MTGVVDSTQDHEVGNKLYVDDRKVWLRNYIDEKHRRAKISYLASSIKANKIQEVVATNTVGNHSKGDETFLNTGMVRFLINVSRTFVGTKGKFNINYFEQGRLNNFMTVTFGDGQFHAIQYR